MTKLKYSNKPLFSVAVAANIRIIVCALASIILLTLDHRTPHLERARGVLATVVYPVHYLAELPVKLTRGLSASLASRRELKDELARLQQKQLLIDAQLQKLTALEAENRRLRLLLESSATIRERVLIAELLTVDVDPYRHQILLNKGARHGVHIGQPLLDQHGVVGQINHVGSLTATALLITDANHALPVQIDRNGLRTLARGAGNFQELELLHLPHNNDVLKGDVLSTSGLGGRFPRGYPVARVTNVELDPGQPFARISAQPTAALDRIREVLIILDTPDTQTAAVAAP